MYALRYQGAFGYTIEFGFMDDRNNAVKVMLDPAPGNILAERKKNHKCQAVNYIYSNHVVYTKAITMINHTCQCCGKKIQNGEEAIVVSYGYASWKSGRFYNRRGADYFHLNCDVAIRQKDDKRVR